MRLAAATAILLLALPALAGCGSSGGGTGSTSSEPPHGAAPAGATARACALDVGTVSSIRATHLSCGKAQRVALAWQRSPACVPATGASRAGCTASSYGCLATATERGWSVSCSRPGRAIAFTAKR